MTGLELGVVAFCLFLSILFSGSEAALLAMTPENFRKAKSDFAAYAAVLEWLLARPRNLMVTILVANMTVNALLVSLVSDFLMGLYGPLKGMIFAVVLMTLVVAVCAEIFPKVLATKHPVAVAVWTAYPVYLLSKAFSPLITMMDGFFALLLRDDEEQAGTERAMTEEELRNYLSISRREGVIEAGEGRMIDSVFRLADTLVREVMVPRTDIDALPEGSDLAGTIEFLRNCQRARIPVFRDDLDEIVGILYAKDLLPFVSRREDDACFDLGSILREPHYVPEVMKCDDLLRDMQLRRVSTAVVVDEYGGTAGIVSFEDLLEEIFGEIRDEFDDEEEEENIQDLPGGGWSVDARMHIDEASEQLPIDFPDGEFDTIGGFVFDRIGHLPSVGEKISFQGHEFRVARVDGHRLSSIDIIPLDQDKER